MSATQSHYKQEFQAIDRPIISSPGTINRRPRKVKSVRSLNGLHSTIGRYLLHFEQLPVNFMFIGMYLLVMLKWTWFALK
jgi:hypothetical protein